MPLQPTYKSPRSSMRMGNRPGLLQSLSEARLWFQLLPTEGSRTSSTQNLILQVPMEHSSISNQHAHNGHHYLVYAACGAGALEEALVSIKSLCIAVQLLPPSEEHGKYTVHILTGDILPCTDSMPDYYQHCNFHTTLRLILHLGKKTHFPNHHVTVWCRSGLGD